MIILHGLLLVNLVLLVYGQGSPPSTRPSTGVQLYLPFESRTLPDYSMIRGNMFGDIDLNSDNINDALFCQSANNGSNIGEWIQSSGTQVALFTGSLGDQLSPGPIYSKRLTGQIALARKGPLADIEGLFKCIIPDENGTNHTLVVGAYSGGTYDSNNGPDANPSMMFSLISTRDANPLVFTLSFNVSDGPPTNVTCTLNETNPLTITSSDLSRVIVDGPESVTQVTVRVRMRQAGTYQCTVSNDRVTDGKIGIVTAVSSSSSLSVTVAGTPSILLATRLNKSHIRLSWSSVSGVVGYEVFYQPLGGNPMSVANITTNTMVDITSGLSLGVTYNLFVVSYGDGTVLPSDRSTTLTNHDLTATTSTSVTLTWSSPSVVPQSYSITRTCHRLCDSQSVTTNDFNSISSPYESSGINPGSECSFTLRGIYGSNQTNLATISAITLSSVPNSSVSSVTISSVKARSMRVSWGEVPCNGQNGPITGYWLYYTNNDSVNIPGGDMREYNLTSLAPYTNYSVRVRPYNDGGIGPTSNEIIQQTSEDVPGVVTNLVTSNVGVGTISISWDVPSIPNGIITVYEIHYTNGSGTYNTTNTQYTIKGLLPNTLYTIEVRAYTSAGGGKWRSINVTTTSIVEGLSVIPLNDSSVFIMWMKPNATISFYTVYYNNTTNNNESMNFSSTSINGTINELNNTNGYTFSISVTTSDSGVYRQGPLAPYVSPKLPTPTIDITSNGNESVGGGSYSITCRVNIIQPLIASLTIKWNKTINSNGESMSIIMSNSANELMFSSLNTSHAGIYTCQAIILILNVGTVMNASNTTIQLQIPSPTVISALSRDSDILAGSPLNITCVTTLDPRVDTPVTIATTWTKGMNTVLPGVSRLNRLIIHDPVLIGPNRYQSVLTFNTLSSTRDNGTYTCTVVVNSNIEYVEDSPSVSNFTTISVTDPTISGFNISPQSFVGLQYSMTCSDSDSHDHFTLTCTASRPSVLVIDMDITLYHNGTVRNGDMAVNGNTYTNTLTIGQAHDSDSGNYSCQAVLNIPQSNVITTSGSSIITIKSRSIPYATKEINVTSIGTTSATISFTVPSIAYTPEAYNINYTGLELQSTLRSTSPVMSPNNITAVDEKYQITLSNLEEANTYNFSVISTNCIGSTSTVVMNFNTLGMSSPVLPVTIPVYISGIFIADTLPIINDTTVNMTWYIPTEPNGMITRYNIDILSSKDGRTNMLIPSEPNTPVYTQLISGLNEGVRYDITIGAVNDVGQGNNVTITVFSKPSNITTSPSGVSATRSMDGTSINVTWNGITIDELGSFFIYKVSAMPTSNSSCLNGSPVVTVMPVHYNKTSVIINVDANIPYSVSVSYVTSYNGSDIDGPPSQSITLMPSFSCPSDTNPIIFGGAGAGALIVIVIVTVVVVIVVVLIMVKRRRSGKKSISNGKDKNSTPLELNLFSSEPEYAYMSLKAEDKKKEVNEYMTVGEKIHHVEESKVDVADNDEEEEQEIAVEPVYINFGETVVAKRIPIPKAQFHDHVVSLAEEEEKGFDEEFKSIPMSTDSPHTVGSLSENKQKNRFLNIFPYDTSRIKLITYKDSDYINACFVDGYKRTDCFVAAQGPLRKTLSDFWNMIWDYKMNGIVMLTGITEGGKKKCEEYWPEGVGSTLKINEGGLIITLTSVQQFADYIIRTMKVEKEGDKGLTMLGVSQYHFTSWPDHGVPQFATSLIGFIKRVQKDHNKDKGVPLLVHCSAGVGRTGTFIMLDSLMDRLKVEETVNVYKQLEELRKKRMYMVQTLPQYVFIHNALDELITCGDTGIMSTNLRSAMGTLAKITPKGMSGYQEQFQLLDEVCYKPGNIQSACSDGLEQNNLSKNRYPNILPFNGCRPRLRTDGNNSDYINASFIDGYKRKNGFIVTQGPLANTVNEFWRMIWEFKCSCIVQLCQTTEDDKEVCHKYWPDNLEEKIPYDKIDVSLISEVTAGDYVIRKVKVAPELCKGHEVTQFHYTMWPEHGHPSSTGPIIELIDMLTRAQMSSGNKAITVVCNDGVGRCGAFVCIHSQLERLKTESEVDIFKYLKTARTKRIGLLSELDHYVFCHDVLLAYIDSFDLYANFKTV